MKFLAVNAVLAASAVQGYLIPPRSNKVDWRVEQKRQIIGAITTLLGKGGKVSAPPGSAPVRVTQQSDSKVPGTKRMKLRYGPYMVPGMNKSSLMGESGMLWNYPDTSIAKPCQTCTIVRQWAGLESPDGVNANIDRGLWLHHMVQLTSGPGRWDPTCYGKSSLPHVDVGSSPSSGERYFSSGNERSIVHMDRKGPNTKAGYALKPSDKYSFIVDLMNINMADKTVWMTMYYDYVDGPLPAGWSDIKTIWFDVNQCGTSEVRPPQQSGKFTINSRPWSPNFTGKIIGLGAHLHDGGVSLDIKASGKLVCTSKAGYGETKEYIQTMAMMMGGKAPKDPKIPLHISSMSACYDDSGLGVAELQKGQSWTVHGNYDYSKYAGMPDDYGKQSEIMAISLMFVAVKPGVRPG